MKAGRICPLDYAIDDQLFDTSLDKVDVLYVIGGLYGNPFALKRIKQLAQDEYQQSGHQPLLVFNGDYHWFDREAKSFEWIEEQITDDLKLLGNVEAELIRPVDSGAGCGCAYPASTSQAAVERSNAIHHQLKILFDNHPQWQAYFKVNRPPAVTISIGDQRIGIVHGDEQWLAGWANDHAALKETARQDQLYTFMKDKSLDVICSTHTCSQVVLEWGDRLVVNNGSSGMATLDQGLFGLYTRIAKKPSNHALYSRSVNGLSVELLALDFDHAAFVDWFDRIWQANSPAAHSYRQRICEGLDLPLRVIKASS